MTTSKTVDRPWLLLIHQIPPNPPYLRVKIGRHLHRVGAMAIKNSVYVLPATDQTREDLAWVYREILSGGGEASICEARFVEGLADHQIEELFLAARGADYAELADQVRELTKSLPRRGAIPDARHRELASDVSRLKKRLAEIAAIDFFASSGREAAAGLVSGLELRLQDGGVQAVSPAPRAPIDARSRVWVTRKGIHVDRIASAWLIQRFIDPEARFKFVNGKGYTPEPGELRFDMFEAEFTHEGDRCTFEVLLDRFRIDDAALRAVAEIVHDIDLKDAKFERPEKPGIERLLTGLALAERDDQARLVRGTDLLGALYEAFQKTID